MSSKSSSDDTQISSLADGEVLVRGMTMPLTITTPSSSTSNDYEIDVTITSSTGESVWHNRMAVTPNEQMALEIPSTLAAGLYKADYILYSSGETVQKKTVSFFIAAEGWKITGIKSFPLVITSAAIVMLKAEIEAPAGANPYLRWSWKEKPIAKGTLSDGLGTVLWTAPADSGVYTVTLEMFPIPPTAGSDYSFNSSLALSTDIVVSKSTAARASNLGPDSSYLSILHMQATLDDTGTGVKKSGKTKAVPIGAPEIVALEDGFGYKLNGSTGMQIPWLALPMDAGVLKPFTISLAFSLTDLAAAGRLVKASANNGSLTLAVTMDAQTGGPAATLATEGATPIVIPWAGPALSVGQRYVLSLSIAPLGSSLTAQWFLDGVQISNLSAAFAPPALTQDGTVTIGGEGGFKGVVEEFGIYAHDSAGRPSTDTDLFARAQKKLLGAGVVLADGFDGINLTSGYTLQGKGQLAAGALVLAAGSSLSLPPVKLEGSALTLNAALSPNSSRSAVLAVAWEGDSQDVQSIRIAANTAELRFELAADGLSLTAASEKGQKTVTLPAADNEAARLLITLQNPADAASALILQQLLLTKERN